MQKSKTDDLSPEARAVQARLRKEWRIRDGAGSLTLLTLCQSLDRLREAQRVLKAEGIVIKDRFGIPRAHPASTVEREARSGMMQCLKALGLDLEQLSVDEDDDAA